MELSTIAILTVLIGGIIIFYVIRVANKQPLNNDSLDKVINTELVNEKADTKQEISEQQSSSKKSSISDIINYSIERDVFWQKRYPTSRILFKIIEVLNIIALIFFVVLLLWSMSESFDLFFITVLPVGFGVVMFFLFKELLLFQVDRNFFEYKQTEKYLK
jgi:hypothetical protein